jgi:hypothetical protein
MMAIGMALLLMFTIVWLRARLLRPWKQLLAWPGRSASAILPSARTSAAATRWRASAWR